MPDIQKKKCKIQEKIRLVEKEIVKKSREIIVTKKCVGLHKILNYYEKLKKKLLYLQG